jgi:hypothetical protein
VAPVPVWVVRYAVAAVSARTWEYTNALIVTSVNATVDVQFSIRNCDELSAGLPGEPGATETIVIAFAGNAGTAIMQADTTVSNRWRELNRMVTLQRRPM